MNKFKQRLGEMYSRISFGGIDFEEAQHQIIQAFKEEVVPKKIKNYQDRPEIDYKPKYAYWNNAIDEINKKLDDKDN